MFDQWYEGWCMFISFTTVFMQRLYEVNAHAGSFSANSVFGGLSPYIEFNFVSFLFYTRHAWIWNYIHLFTDQLTMERPTTHVHIYHMYQMVNIPFVIVSKTDNCLFLLKLKKITIDATPQYRMMSPTPIIICGQLLLAVTFWRLFHEYDGMILQTSLMYGAGIRLKCHSHEKNTWIGFTHLQQ